MEKEFGMSQTCPNPFLKSELKEEETVMEKKDLDYSSNTVKEDLDTARDSSKQQSLVLPLTRQDSAKERKFSKRRDVLNKTLVRSMKKFFTDMLI